MSNPINNCEAIFNHAKELGFGELHLKIDSDTDLVAITAIHNTKLGPALGGCRCRQYENFSAAVEDAMRLAAGMTYKAAIMGLPLGGGKSVLYKPEKIVDRDAYFQAFGKFVESLNGRYITAVDSGTTPKDMDSVAKQTQYATSLSDGDPSPITAEGVFIAIQATVKHLLNTESLRGLKVAIQGVGNVGYILAKYLYEAGAELILADTNQVALERCAAEFSPHVVSTEEIYEVDCDIFAPCALGAILNDDTIPKLKAKMIVGSANNQLQSSRHGQALYDRGILYGPDYVVNAGGLIYAAAQFFKTPFAQVKSQLSKIYDITMDIYERSAREKRPTDIVADEIAEERLQK